MYHFNFVKIAVASVIAFFLCLSSCTKAPLDVVGDDLVNVKEEANLDEAVSSALPHLYIEISDGEEVTSKDIYLNALLSIDGVDSKLGLNEVKTRIKGRGNSTWVKPKKPYRLKLDQSISILGLPAAKDWVLLANYNDYTLMTNAVALQIGKQLGMPYTHDIISVDLTVNGKYLGNYNLTQQVEVGENRVNVGTDGVLWELDSYFDEDVKFKSEYFNLPVMLKGPKEVEKNFEMFSADFNKFVGFVNASTFPKNAYKDVFDKQQFVNFLIVNMLVGNGEICHPKSVFMHRKAGGKYTMGPLWDFDFAFGFSEEHNRTYFNYVDLSILREADSRVGAVFYKRLLEDRETQDLLRATWNSYKENKFNELMLFVEKFAASIRESQKKDYAIWKVGNNNHAKNKADLKTFLRKRTAVVDTFIKQLK